MSGFRVAPRRRAGAVRPRARPRRASARSSAAGCPPAAFGGRARLMELLAPLGPTTRPARCRATRSRWRPAWRRSTLLAEPGAYERLERTSAAARGRDPRAAWRARRSRVNRVGSMLTLFFHPGPVRSTPTPRRATPSASAASSAHCLSRRRVPAAVAVRGGVRLAGARRGRDRAHGRGAAAPSPPRSTRPRPRDRAAGRPGGGRERGVGPAALPPGAPRRGAGVRARGGAALRGPGWRRSTRASSCTTPAAGCSRGRTASRAAARRLPVRPPGWSASARRATSTRSRRSPTWSRSPRTCVPRATATATTAAVAGHGAAPGRPARRRARPGQGRAAGRGPRAAARAGAAGRAGPPPAGPSRAAAGAEGVRRVSFRDLREWIDALRARASWSRSRAGRPAPRDHGDRRPHDEGRRAGAAVPQRARARAMPLLINQFGTERRMCLALGVERLEDVARADRRA